MTSIDIANRALGYLGLATINGFDDDDANAERAASAWPECFEAFLQEHPWSFALRTVIPVRLDASPFPAPYRYAHMLPNDLIRIASVTTTNARRLFGFELPRRPEIRYEVRRLAGRPAPVLCCNFEDIAVSYVTRDVTIDYFSPQARDALTVRLAADLCLTIQRDPEMVERLLQLYMLRLKGAIDIEPTQHSVHHLDACHYDDARLVP